RRTPSCLAGIIILDPSADLFFGLLVGDLCTPAEFCARQGGVHVIIPAHHRDRQARQWRTDVDWIKNKIKNCSQRPRNPKGNTAERALAYKRTKISDILFPGNIPIVPEVISLALGDVHGT